MSLRIVSPLLQLLILVGAYTIIILHKFYTSAYANGLSLDSE